VVGLGPGWRHGYAVRLHWVEGRPWVQQGDGRWIGFRPDARGGWTAGPDGRLEARADGAGWRWVWPQGLRRLEFDRRGRLEAIVAGPDGREAEGGRLRPWREAALEAPLVVRLVYDRRGRLSQVRDPQGRVLRLVYHPVHGRLVEVRGPGGWRVRYRYDRHGNLAAAEGPDGGVRRYRYEDPRGAHRLTGIDDATGRPAGRWWYGARGRAERSRDAAGRLVRLRRLGAGAVEVRDGEGRRVRYWGVRTAGGWRLARLEGEAGACAVCPAAARAAAGAAGLRWRWDGAGRLIAITSPAGERVRIVRDGRGLVRAVVLERAGAGAGLRPAVLAGAARAGTGRAGAGQVVLRIGWDGAGRPVRLERPSVRPGRWHVLELERDRHGRIVRRTERGYAPDPEAPGGWRAIARRVGYRWLGPHRVEVDGPLPGRGDVWRIRHDPATRLVEAVEGPEGTGVRVLARNEAGRITRLAPAGEAEVAIRYDARGRPVAVAQGGRGLEARWDAAGRLESLVFPDGRALRLERDGWGRVVGLHAPDGSLVRTGAGLAVLDRRGRVRARLPAGPTPPAAGPSPAALGPAPGPGPGVVRLAAWLVGVRDGAGRLSAYGLDDFGRLVLEHSPARGRWWYRYDAAGRLTERIFLGPPRGRPEAQAPGSASPVPIPVGAASSSARPLVTRYRYDAAGRLIGVTLPDGESWRLEWDRAGRLLALEGPAGYAERYRYDGTGRLVEHVVVFGPRRYVVRHRYDGATGRRTATALPDGTRIRYRRHAQTGRLRAVLRAGWLRDEPVVVGLDWAPLGGPLEGLRHGNGLDERDRAAGPWRIERIRTGRLGGLAWR
ncbi:MAG TPA: hypothetical protein ENK20_05630, partial [Chromatiales bacterium]|nr:hypothetical protein [Chromatiales bacterium]